MEDLPYLSESYSDQSVRRECLKKNVTALEDYLRCGIYDQEYCDELLEAVRSDVGEEGQDRQSSLRGLGFALDHNDVLLPTPVVIDAAVAYRHDVEIRQVDDVERVLIHYEVYDEDGRSASFYVPPLAVLSNSREQDTLVSMRANHSVLRMIDSNASIAREKLFVSEFYTSSADEQYRALNSIANDLHDNLEVEYGVDVPVSIGTSGYYQAPSEADIQSINWKDYYHDVPSIGDEASHSIDGVIFSVVYLEVINGLRSKLSSSNDLNLGYGLPCLIVIDQTKGAVYYVPVIDIVSFYSESDTI
jgi:hypothetical protein